MYEKGTWQLSHVCSWLYQATVFLRSCRLRRYYLLLSLLVLCGYYSRAAFISLESPKTSTTAGYLRYVRVRRWRLLGTVSNTRSLSVLLSAVGTTRTKQTVLALTWWPSSEIIRIRVRVPHLLAATTIRGRRLFRLRDSDCAATIRRRRLFEGGVYSKKYGIHFPTCTNMGTLPTTIKNEIILTLIQFCRKTFISSCSIVLHMCSPSRWNWIKRDATNSICLRTYYMQEILKLSSGRITSKFWSV